MHTHVQRPGRLPSPLPRPFQVQPQSPVRHGGWWLGAGSGLPEGLRGKKRGERGVSKDREGWLRPGKIPHVTPMYPPWGSPLGLPPWGSPLGLPLGAPPSGSNRISLLSAAGGVSLTLLTSSALAPCHPAGASLSLPRHSSFKPSGPSSSYAPSPASERGPTSGPCGLRARVR